MSSKWPVFAMALLSAAPASAQMQIIVKPSMPSLGPEEKDAKDPDTIYCRPPQNQSDSRLLGPKTCRTNRIWDELHAQGLDVGADGKSIVASEKYRNVRGD